MGVFTYLNEILNSSKFRSDFWKSVYLIFQRPPWHMLPMNNIFKPTYAKYTVTVLTLLVK